MDTNTDYAALYYTDISQDVEELETNVREYPASSIARFMLLYHLKKNSDPRFDQVAKQTGIYLQNPHWMEYQLSKLQHAKTETEEEGGLIEKTQMEGAEEGNKLFEESTLVNEETENDAADSEIQTEFDALVVEANNEEEIPFAVNEQISENLPSEVEVPEAVNEGIFNEAEVTNKEDNEIIEQQIPEDLPVAVNEQNSENLPAETAIVEDENIEITEKTNKDAVLNNEFVEFPAVEEVKEENVSEEIIPEPQLEPAQNENVE